jgi:hypothetical protein
MMGFAPLYPSYESTIEIQFSNSLSAVIVRLDRTIQYSRGA